MGKLTTFFEESYRRSLGTIYRDFYSEKELIFLQDELWSLFEKSQKQKNIFIKSYNLPNSDPLLRINIDCIVIICPSTQFFASKIRALFHKQNLQINRSLHFHPEKEKELYYIEIQSEDSKTLTKLISEIESSYLKILKLTQDFPEFWKKVETITDFHSGDTWELIHWLIQKGMIWEGGIFKSKKQSPEKYGEIINSPEIIKWFDSIKQEGEEIKFYARESKLPCLLNDTYYFYIAFVYKDFKLLLQGSFTQFAQFQGINDIPYFSHKFHRFLEVEKIEYKSGLGRTIRRIFNSLPVELLFLMEESAYVEIYKVIIEQSLKTQNRSNGIIIKNDLALVLTAIPEKNWSEEKWLETSSIVQNYLPKSTHKLYHSLLSNSIQGYHLIRSQKIEKQTLFQISSQIEFLFRPWMDSLKNKWEERYKHENFPSKILFREDYISTHDPEKAVYDLHQSTKLGEKIALFSISKTESDATLIQAITHDKAFQLSKWVTALTSFGLSPISQRVYRFSVDEKIISKTEFFFETFQNNSRLYDRLKDALLYTIVGKLSSDTLSGLILKTDLDANGIYFIKSIRDYCLQTNPSFNKSDFNEILLQYPEFCSELWNYFYNKFYEGKIKNGDELKKLSDSAKTLREDEVLNSMRTTVLAILRTNFFGTNFNENFKEAIGLDRESIAYKIDSSIPISLPNPKPFREIFAYSSWYQGIHLRGGPVARGGLRFSDRPSDFRTEILSLMKTQMVKNTVIVPVGSKGGFVLTKNQFLQDEIPMVNAYKAYIRSLLSLTDNRKGTGTIPFASKKGPFAYDELDPYLVVAADKGTAQLSDTANEISINYNYWLGDAFASGGSRGYSHKEYGITAKGALVTADRHLRNLDIDYLVEPITVAGIGDLGGDVFGNGLLNSKAYKLVAAFNHKHIFLDPNPDPKKSFEERKRLFFGKTSGWDSYNPKLISEGGGVFNRTEKSIKLSPQIKEALGIEEDHLSGPALITAILKSPVDLLYNGGIGTYIKSKEEDNTKVGDPSNNEVRINGNEVRAKVISEGGNLGLTQLGRIEYDLNGGRIYTDALDNSAGVDLSDHEVNLKIFFRYLIDSGKLKDDKKRDEKLKQIAFEVCDSVLLDNALQSLAIEVDYLESIKKGWDNFTQTSKYLIDKKLLNPFTEKIPLNNQSWVELQEKSKGIPRPILCVLLSYTKMDLYSEAISENLFKIDEFPEMYLDYFPKTLIKNYNKELFNHPLKAEILNTQIVNFYINLMGIGGLFLLSNGQTQEGKMKTFKSIIEFLYSIRVDKILKEIAGLREKTIESENMKVISEIRERVYLKWGSSKTINLQGSKLVSYISKESKLTIESL